jgi:hypothetical protein
MIEIFTICTFNFLSIFLFLYGEKNIFFSKSSNIKNINQEFFAFNFLFVLNIIWISSIFDLNKNFVFTTIIIVLLLNFLKNLNFNFELKIKNNLNFVFLFFVTFSLSIIIAHDLFFSHDVRLYWIEKALLFYNDFFIIDDQTIKPEYPHYGTYLWGFIWQLNFLDLEYFGRIVYLMTYIFSIFYILNKINFSKKYLKYFIFFLVIALTFKIKWFDGRQDLLIFSFNTFIFAYLYEIISNKSKKTIHVVGLILAMNLLLWTKNDSFLYIITYLILILIYLKHPEKLKLIIGITTILVVKIIFYKIYNVSLNPNLDTFEKNLFKHINDIDLFYRLSQIFLWYLVGLIRNPILLLSLILLVIIFKNKNYLKEYSYFILAYLLISLGIILVYLITKYDFPFHMIGSVGRVFFQFSMILFLPILKFYEKKKLL